MTIKAITNTPPSYLFNVITPLVGNLMLDAFHQYKHYKPIRQHTGSYFYVLNNVIYLKII